MRALRIRLRWFAIGVAEHVGMRLPGGVIGNALRMMLFRMFGAKIKWPLRIDSGVWVRFPGGLTAGKGLTVSRWSVLNCAGGLRFGDDCLVGYGAYIGTAAHVVPEDAHEPVARAGHAFRPVTIGSGCWIGAHACVLPGVSLAEGCVVGAGAVVTKSFGPGSVVAGVPARVIRVRGTESQ